jgi:hypothetical protein
MLIEPTADYRLNGMRRNEGSGIPMKKPAPLCEFCHNAAAAKSARSHLQCPLSNFVLAPGLVDKHSGAKQ